MGRLPEFFGDSVISCGLAEHNVYSTVHKVHKQERDWTCGIASLVTLLSGKTAVDYTEERILHNCDIRMGPLCSRILIEILQKMEIPVEYRYGAEHSVDDKPISFIVKLMKDYDIALETCLNGGHWIVLLSYTALGHPEKDIITFYDPYYDTVRTMSAEEIISMWIPTMDGLLCHDYIAIRKKEHENV